MTKALLIQARDALAYTTDPDSAHYEDQLAAIAALTAAIDVQKPKGLFIDMIAQHEGLAEELRDAPEPEPVLVVKVEPDYWYRGHYYEGSKPYINPLEVWKLPVGTKLYTTPPAPSEPVGYLYTNLQSGEYHVSDYDDDYRGPERVLWCIEPVYRRAKGQS